MNQAFMVKQLLKKHYKESNKQKRFVWAKKHKEWTLDQWKSVLWSDESKCEIFGSSLVILKNLKSKTCFELFHTFLFTT